MKILKRLVFLVETILLFLYTNVCIGDVGIYTSIALDSNNYPHISYRDQTNLILKYAKWNGISWDIEIVDDDGMPGMYSSIIIDKNNYPHISYHYLDYYGFKNYYQLRYARHDGTKWKIETIDSLTTGVSFPPKDEGVGEFTSIDLDSNNNPHISYYKETNYELKYASFRCCTIHSRCIQICP